MDYSRFCFKAEVDWMEFEIHTQERTNFQTVQGSLRSILNLPKTKNPYVKAEDRGAGSAAKVYRFRIYDPQNWRHVTEILRKLESHHSFAGIPKITAIEITFDAYSKGEATLRELAELVANYYRNMSHPVSKNRRLYRDYKGSPESMHIRRPSLVRHIEEGWQIGIGSITDDLYQHAYLKTTDKGLNLPIDKYRARLEIRLQGAKLPGLTLNEWSNYSFESISNFFKFRKLKDSLKPGMSCLAEALWQIGEKSKRNRAEGGTRLYDKSTRADSPLNRKSYDALRELSRRWKRNRTTISLISK